MKKSLRNGALFCLCGLLLAVLGACSDTVDDITNNIDCHSVCKRYADCFNADYDVDGCSDRCDNSADSDAERQRKLRACNSCIENRSCTETTFVCATDCAGIVP